MFLNWPMTLSALAACIGAAVAIYAGDGRSWSLNAIGGFLFLSGCAAFLAGLRNEERVKLRLRDSGRYRRAERPN